MTKEERSESTRLQIELEIEQTVSHKLIVLALFAIISATLFLLLEICL